MKLLFPTDFSDASTPAFEYAVMLARQFEAQLELVNVVEDIIPPGESLRFADEERRFAFAVCPSGYEADRTFDGENLSSILASQYNCSQSDAAASSTTK